MYKSKYLGRFISCFVLLCFVGILGISTAYASELSNLEINREEIQSVRSSAADVNDNSNYFINNPSFNNLYTLSGYLVQSTIAESSKYASFNTYGIVGHPDSQPSVIIPTTPVTFGSGRADPSWLNRTIYLNNIYMTPFQIYLAQGNISNPSTISTNASAAEQKNKFWLAWRRNADGNTEGDLPGGAWYNSNLSILYNFNNYTGATGTAAQNEAAGYTKGIQIKRADAHDAIPGYFHTYNVNYAADNQTDGDYYLNIRMPIYSLTPYIKMSNLDSARIGYTLKDVSMSYYSQASDYLKSGSARTSATTQLYVAEDNNSVILYTGVATQLSALNVDWARHVYTLTFDYCNGTGRVKRWDILAGVTIPSSTRVAPGEGYEPNLKKIGYSFDGWYTAAATEEEPNRGKKVFDKYGRPELTVDSSSFWLNAAGGKCTFALSKSPKLNAISGIDTGSNVEATNSRVYTYDDNGNRTGIFPTYAHWNPITYHVKYVYNNNVDGNDHNPNNPTEWVYDQEQQIKDPTRIGYTFTGWKVKNGDMPLPYISSGNRSVKNLTTIQNRTVTLVAQRTPNVYKINFHSNYPNGAADQVVSWNVTYDSAEYKNDTAPGFTCTHYHMIGYTFNGSNDLQYYWNKGPNDQNYYDNIMSRSNDWWHGSKYKNPYDIDVYAKWDKNPYVIVYDSNGGSAVASELSYSGDNHILAAGPTRAGYTFVGWSKCSDVNYFGNPIDQNTRTGYYKNLAETDPLKMAQGNNSRNYFRTADANSPGDTIFNIEKWAGEVRFVAIWAHVHNEANMDNLRNGGDNGRTYPCTIDGVNSFYVNTTSQNKFYVGVGNTWMKLSPWYNINRARLLKDNNWSANNSETYNQSDFTESSLSNVFTAADSSSNNSHGARDVHKSLMTLNKRFSFTLTDDNSYNLHSSIDSTCHWTDNAHADCNVSSTANSNNTRVIGDKTKPVHDNNDWNTTVDLKNRDITNYSSMKLNYVASDQCNSFYGSGLDKNNTWMKIANKDTKIGFYIQSVFI